MWKAREALGRGTDPGVSLHPHNLDTLDNCCARVVDAIEQGLLEAVAGLVSHTLRMTVG